MASTQKTDFKAKFTRDPLGTVPKKIGPDVTIPVAALSVEDTWPAIPLRNATAKQAALVNDAEAMRLQIPEALRQFPVDTIPETMLRGDDPRYTPISAYRADPTGKYGGKDGMETLPITLEPNQLYTLARVMAATKDFGTPQLSAQDLAAFALKEGRSDLGTNDIHWQSPNAKAQWANFGKTGTLNFNPGDNQYLGYDPYMKGDKEFYESLTSSGVHPESASFATRLRNKQGVSSRLGIPLPAAWNGTGTQFATAYRPGEKGTTGFDYANDYTNFQTAAAHPKNAAFVAMLQDAIDSGYKTPFKRPDRAKTVTNKSEENKKTVKAMRGAKK